MAEYLTVSGVIFTIMTYEWVHWYFQWAPNPAVFLTLGFGLIAYAATRVVMMFPKLRALKQEARASQNYHHALKEISDRGWLIFHDVQDPQGRNLGTLLVGAAGVYNIHVRYQSRAGTGYEIIEEHADGSLWVAGNPTLGNPKHQASRGTKSAYELLASAGLETVPIQTVVVYPAWEINSRVDTSEVETVWVLNESMLVDRLKNLPSRLEARQVIELCSLLEQRNNGNQGVRGAGSD